MSVKGNGAAKSWLLWVNTILTLMAAFIGGRLWDKIDRINDTQIKSDTEMRIRLDAQIKSDAELHQKVEEISSREKEISKEHHQLFQRLTNIEKAIKP